MTGAKGPGRGHDNGATAALMKERLQQALAPVHLVIEDESAMHLGHPGAAGGGGHFQVTVVSTAFEGKSTLEQHRLVNAALKGMVGGEIHALGLETVAASQWQQVRLQQSEERRSEE